MAEGNSDALSCPSFEPDLSRNDLVFEQGHIFEEQPHHALAVPIRGAWIMPHTGEIFHEVSNGLVFERSQTALFLLVLPPCLFLDLCEFSQAGVPVRFQHISHQTVLRIDSSKAPLPQFCPLPSTFHLFLP